MLAGLLAPTSGEATVAGWDVRQQPAAVRASVGLVTDAPGLYDQMTPDSYLAFFGRIYGLPDGDLQRRIDTLLGLFELQAVRGTRMAGFSRGMQQKVALARALLHEPAVLFLDEPTAGLDPLAARVVRDLIVGLKNSRRSIVLCTHDLDEAERLADNVTILSRGRIVASDSPAALRSGASRETRVDVLLAQPAPNALGILRSLAGVLDPLLEPHVGAAGGRLSYRTTAPTTVNPAVIAALVGAGAAILSVRATLATLEDVYATALLPAPPPEAALEATLAR
jgi:ABC-2 type transport system ATP-binding protein